MEYNPDNQKPTRNGVYIREFTVGECHSHFKDGKWMNTFDSRLISNYQDRPWREPLTEWFDGKTTCPDKPGVYEIKAHDFDKKAYSYWDGVKWGYRELTVAKALEYRFSVAYGPIEQWRGFTCNQEV